MTNHIQRGVPLSERDHILIALTKEVLGPCNGP
jgi:hypothetical protein